jgi:hypothetical protein
MIAAAAAELGSAVDVELWASQLLGMFWRARSDLPLTEALEMDAALVYGQPLLSELLRIGGRGAALAILGLAEVEDGELGGLAKEALDQAGLWASLPQWASDVGESAIVGAAVMRDPVFDDARTVFLESRHRDGAMLALGVLIDRNLGGIAKDVLLADSIDEVERTMHAHAGEQPVELVLERVEPGIAAGLIEDAIEMTDMTWGAPVAEDYWHGRALAVLRCDQTPGIVPAEDPTEMPEAERDALRAEFLASPEGAGFAADGDEAWAAALAINFAADYAGGDPLRWSPVVVELFLADWVPRKVFTTPGFVAALPGALDAWVRFAARKRGVPEPAAALTRGAITEFSEEMREQASDPALAGPSKQLLQAMGAAGMDLEDPEALRTFRAEPNAGAGAGEALVISEVGEHPGAVEDSILQVKVQLAGVTRPPVWRRLQLPARTPLDDLHHIIQAAFGWEDHHLHVFESGRERIGPADPELELDFADERRFTLADLASEVGDRVTYTYDFGDDWEHHIVVEKVLEPAPGVTGPILVTAKGACPPEDCGGPWGWSELKEALADPDAEEHAERREWLGLGENDVLDPAAVDADVIRGRLAMLSHSRR